MIACPKCRAYMFTGRLNSVEIDSCTKCQGIWLDQGELAELAKTPQDLAEDAPANATKYACPRCGSNLFERPYSKEFGLLVDVCRECRGVYLDRGELQKIQSFAQSLDTVFTPERREQWEQRARRNEALSAVYRTETPVAKESLNDRAAFIRNVYTLLTVTLVVTAVGSVTAIASGMARTLFLPALIGEIIVFLITLGVRRVPILNTVMLLTYTFLTGITLGAVVQAYAAAGYAACVWEALVLTAVIFVALTVYVHVTKQDFSWLGGMLFATLLGLVIAGFFLIFFGGSFSIFLYSVVGALVFTGYILYDTSNIILKYETDEVVSAVIDLYLDIVNLFLDLLRILSYLSRRD